MDKGNQRIHQAETCNEQAGPSSGMGSGMGMVGPTMRPFEQMTIEEKIADLDRRQKISERITIAHDEMVRKVRRQLYEHRHEGDGTAVEPLN